MTEVKVRFFCDVKVPTKAHAHDAGIDLHAPETVLVESGKSLVIRTGICVTVPKGYCVVAYPRSSYNVECGVLTTGLIDANYTGEIKLRLYNFGSNDLWIDKGDRFAQLVVQRIPKVRFTLDVGGTEEKRGSDGFGSSGR